MSRHFLFVTGKRLLDAHYYYTNNNNILVTNNVTGKRLLDAQRLQSTLAKEVAEKHREVEQLNNVHRYHSKVLVVN